ncbi:ABC transporter permease [Microbacterium pseudoresistens]
MGQAMTNLAARGRVARRPNRRRRGPARIFVYLAVPLAAIALWWLLSAGSDSLFFPPLSDILDRFRQMWVFAQFGSDVLPSLGRMFAGFILAVIGGVAVGVLLGSVRPLYQAVSPLIHFGRAIPAPALLPIAMMMLGVGDQMKILLIGFVCIFPVLLNTIDAVASLDRGHEDVTRVFHFTRTQRVVYVLLPYSLPRIVAGARISLSIALIMMIVTEMLAGTNGIGFVTLQAQQAFDIRGMWAGMILLGLIGALLSIAFLWMERRLLTWNPNVSES